MKILVSQTQKRKSMEPALVTLLVACAGALMTVAYKHPESYKKYLFFPILLNCAAFAFYFWYSDYQQYQNFIKYLLSIKDNEILSINIKEIIEKARTTKSDSFGDKPILFCGMASVFSMFLAILPYIGIVQASSTTSSHPSSDK